MDTKYEPLNHGGLEAVERNDGMEVLTPNNNFPVDRKSAAFTSSEPVEVRYHMKEGHGNYYLGSETLSDTAQTTYSAHGKPVYFIGDFGENGQHGQASQAVKDGRRYCGMRKAIFITLVVAMVLLVCVAAVLGGVLGVLLPEKNSTNSVEALANDGVNATDAPLQTMPKTGIATTISADDSGRLLAYYQDPEGRIIENSYLDDKWTLDDRSMVDASVVTSEADAGSPLAAVAYEYDGTAYRRLFYITSLGAVMTTYSTTASNNIATSWSSPESIIPDDPAQGGSPALTACAGPGLNGIRVYYGSQSDYINEVQYDFGDDSWSQGGYIEASDPNSGVACSVFNDPGDLQIVNVYFRDKATKRLRQSWIEFDSDEFNDGPKAPLNQTIAQGSDIAVCSDDTANEYVFFQAEGGLVTKSALGPDRTNFGSFKSIKGATIGSKLAASFLDSDPSSSGPALTFQPSSSDSTMWLSQISRSDAELLDAAIT